MQKRIKNFVFIVLGILLFLPFRVFAAEVIKLESVEKNELKLNHNKELKEKNLVLKDKAAIEEDASEKAASAYKAKVAAAAQELLEKFGGDAHIKI